MTAPEETPTLQSDADLHVPAEQQDVSSPSRAPPCSLSSLESPSPPRKDAAHPATEEHLSLHVDSQEMSSQGVDSTLAMMMELGSRDTGEFESQEQDVAPTGSAQGFDSPNRDADSAKGDAEQEDVALEPAEDVERAEVEEDKEEVQDVVAAAVPDKEVVSKSVANQEDDSFTEYLRRGQVERVLEEDDLTELDPFREALPGNRISTHCPTTSAEADSHESNLRGSQDSIATERATTPPLHESDAGRAAEGSQTDSQKPEETPELGNDQAGAAQPAVDPSTLLREAIGIMVTVIYKEINPDKIREVPNIMKTCDNGAEIWLLHAVIEKYVVSDFPTAPLRGRSTADQANIYKEMIRELQACLPEPYRTGSVHWTDDPMDSCQDLARAFKRNFAKVLEPCLSPSGGQLAMASDAHASSSSSSQATHELERKQARVNQSMWVHKYAGVVKRQRLASMGEDDAAGTFAGMAVRSSFHAEANAVNAPAHQSRPSIGTFLKQFE